VEYLRHDEPWALDVELEAEVNGEVICRTNARELYWTIDQMLAHATVNGAELRAGDLFGTGTISSPGNPGCLLERDGPFLADGDEVVLRGRAGDISLGEVTGVITPAEG
jgi:fumarylacetoacetase